MVDARVLAPPTKAVSHQAHINTPAFASAPANTNVHWQVRELGFADPAPAGGGTLFTEQFLLGR
jgi:hypothetical protein